VSRLRSRALLGASLLIVAASAPARAFVSPAAARRNASGVEMVFVPSAKLRVGAPARWGGAHAGQAVDASVPNGIDVSVGAFWIDRTEVTAGAYAKCVAAGACSALVQGDTAEPSHTPACTAARAGLEDHPINCVTWSEAASFCTFAKKRLPSEAEFELAARGTTERAFPWGDEPPQPRHANACDARCVERMHNELNDDDYANLWADTNGDDGFGFTSPAGSYPAGASPFGALDMSGNVEEWVADVWSSTPGKPPPADPNADHIVRGGSWDLSAIEYFTANRRAKEA
jgi:formylglycine-generating enzyme required for sulfatase activity